MELTGSFIKALGICTAYRRNIQNPTSNPGATNLLVNPDDLRCNGLSFSENGRFLYSSHNDGVLRLFSGDASGPSTTSTSSSSSSANTSSGNTSTSNSNSSEHDFYCKTDGCRLVTATHHELAVLHAASTPARKAPCAISYHNLHENKIVRQFKGHEGRVTSISMAPNADIFISCGLDAKYYLWDIRMPQPAAMGSFDATEDASTKFPPAQPQASFDTSGSVFAIAVPQRGLAMFDAMKIGLPLVNFNESRVPFQQLQSPLLVWSTKPMRLPTMPEDISPLPPAFPELASFVDMKFSPDENFIALSTSDRGILILDAFEPKEERAVLTSHAHDPNYPSSVSWSADSRFLLVGGCDGRLWAYDMTNPPPQPNTIDGDFPPSSWRPGHWEPQVLIVGENYLGHSASSAPYPPPLSTPESEAAGKAIKDAARKHKTDRYEKQQKSRQSFATSMNISIDAVFPQISASINPALAQSTDEMISRMDAPISHVRCHPTNAIFASASTKTISIWAPPLS